MCFEVHPIDKIKGSSLLAGPMVSFPSVARLRDELKELLHGKLPEGDDLCVLSNV